MNYYELLIDLHKRNDRQGPGSDALTKVAIQLSGLKDIQSNKKLQIADIGCGTGASTLILAEELKAQITAVDLFPDFLKILQEKAAEKNLEDNITTLTCSMATLPFATHSLDAIWSEGAIYNMGFAEGVSYFKQFLKDDGILAVSEISWLTSKRPDELTSYWNKEYPQIARPSEKIKIMEDEGFTLMGYFPLPKICWTENYYALLQEKFKNFLSQHSSNDAQSIVDAEIKEIDLYRKYHKYYSYGFYIAQFKNC